MSMELILATPVEQLVPKLIAFNNEELMQQVNEALTLYTEKVYDDSNIVEAKADKAKLNAFVKSLNDERIRIGRVYTAPYEKFKTEVDEVVMKVKCVVETISESVDDFERRRQAEKKEVIEKYFDSHISADLGVFVTFDKIFKSNWLNATASMKSICAEIDQTLDRINTELSTIKELKSPDETTLLTLYFRSLSLATALMENTRLQAERARISELNGKPVVGETPVEKADVQENTDEEMFSVVFRVHGTKDQLKKLSQFMTENNIKYTR